MKYTYGGKILKTRRTVLVVDDMQINRQILTKILSNEYDVLDAENGKVAMDILHESSDKISAILLDLIMPEMDGYEVLKRMQDNYILKQIPIIICTQKEGNESEIEALKLGADDFVSKPYSPELIRIRLKHLIEMVEARSTINVLEQDKLTGILNQEAFNVNVGRNSNDDEQHILISADIEQFKMYNEVFGVAEGDRLLKYVADVLKENFADDMSEVARAYADRFFVFTKASDDIINVLQTISDKINEYTNNNKINIKFGIYEIEKNDNSIRIMCDRAVVASDLIKGQYDRNYCFYDAELRKKLLIDQQITACMNEALANREFVVYYQPKFDADKETIAGAEALVRWI